MGEAVKRIPSVFYGQADDFQYRVLGNGPHRCIRERDYRKLRAIASAAQAIADLDPKDFTSGASVVIALRPYERLRRAVADFNRKPRRR